MSITDELRGWMNGSTLSSWAAEHLTAIADRIDAEHESACGEAYGNGVQSVALPDMTAYVKLPKDADGEVWHIGDRTESGQIIEAMGLNKHGWHFVGTVNEIGPAIHRHYHAPTVEDVLREMHAELDEVTALYVGEAIDSDERDRNEARIFAEYAKRLTLAGDAE